MARYAVSFRRSAQKDLRRLDSPTQRRVVRAAEKLGSEPRPPGRRKPQASENAFPIRAVDYRIIYTMDDEVLIVAIERVRHRREVYR